MLKILRKCKLTQYLLIDTKQHPLSSHETVQYKTGILCFRNDSTRGPGSKNICIETHYFGMSCCPILLLTVQKLVLQYLWAWSKEEMEWNPWLKCVTLSEVGTSAILPLLRYSASDGLRTKQRYSGLIRLAD